DPAGVERDRLADEAEGDVRVRDLRRRVAKDDQARLVTAATAYGRERAHAQPVQLARPEDLRLQMLVLAGERLRVLAEGMRVELVGGHVREIACPVRPFGDERGPFRGVAKLPRVEVADHDALDSTRALVRVVCFPPRGAVAAENRPVDESACLL